MQRHTLPCIAAILTAMVFLLPAAAGSGLSIGVDREQQASLLLTTQDTATDRPKTWGVELHNDGSTPFTGRVRLDVLNADNTTVFRTWTDPVQVEPGAFAARTLTYYTPDRAGNLTARITAHYGTERITRSVPFTTEQRDIRQGFQVSPAWTDETTVNLRVAAPADVDTFHVAVNDRSTRRFTQQDVINRGGSQLVTLGYYPPISDAEQAQVRISSSDGKYHYTREVELRQPIGWIDRAKQWLAVLVENTVIM